MALSGTINGTFSGWETWKGIPFITWSATQSIAGNYSTVTVNLYFRRSSSYYSYNLSTHSNTSNVDGQTNYSADSDFDLRAGTGDYLIRTVSGIVVNHNADGSKTCWIGWSGNCNTSLGTYNFGETVTLDTIPREAYITTASVNFTVADAAPYTAIAFSLWNGGSYYVQALLYVGGTLITTRNLGAVTSASFNLTDAENHSIYATIPSATSNSMYWRIKTYSDAGYTVQIGSNMDKAGTCYITDTYSKPTFTTYTIANVDEALANTDKYGNVLITSNTNTLSGSSAKIISGYNKPRGTILNANKMTPLHSSTANKYRFASGSQYAEVATGAGDLTVDLNDVTANSFTMTAYDSRNYTTAVAGTVTSIVTPTAVNLYDLVLKRDNNVDALTKLQFSGNYWKSNFGSVDNAIVCQWRYKLTTNTWNEKDGTCTISNATPAVVTKNGHGFATGDMIWFSTTGSLPTGLTANTTQYYAINNDANTFWIATSYANAIAGTKVATSSAGAGTHTVHQDSIWTAITPDDTDGALSYDDYISGDLGASGFDTDKSFNVEVRLYDKLTNIIVEGTISKGTPVVDFTQTGIALLGQYDTGVGGALQVNGDTNITGDTTLGGALTIDSMDSYDAYTRRDMHRQAVINGNFDIWQRYTSVSVTDVANIYCADHWRDYCSKAGGTLPTLTRSRQTLTAGELDKSFYFTRLATNGAGTSLGANSFHGLYQPIEHGTRYLCGDGKKVTVSFWARSSIANKKLGVFWSQVYGTGGSPSTADDVYGVAWTLTSNWTYYEHTFDTVTLSGKTFGTANDDFVQLIFWHMWGTNYANRVGEVNAETYVGSGNIDIAQVQLNAGEVALPFFPKTFDQELKDCMRYFQKSAPYGTAITTPTYAGAPFLRGGQYNNYGETVFLTVPMRRTIANADISFMSYTTGTANRHRDLSAGADFTPAIDAVCHSDKSFNVGNDGTDRRANVVIVQWNINTDFY